MTVEIWNVNSDLSFGWGCINSIFSTLFSCIKFTFFSLTQNITKIAMKMWQKREKSFLFAC